MELQIQRNRFEFRLPPDLRELFILAAQRDGRPLASWVRSRLKQIAEEEVASERGKRGGRPKGGRP